MIDVQPCGHCGHTHFMGDREVNGGGCGSCPCEAWRPVRVSDYARSMTYVHPKVYAQRAACPLWTNQPDPAHVHNRDCSGQDDPVKEEK